MEVMAIAEPHRRSLLKPCMQSLQTSFLRELTLSEGHYDLLARSGCSSIFFRICAAIFLDEFSLYAFLIWSTPQLLLLANFRFKSAERIDF
jgi:hypothetical protein